VVDYRLEEFGLFWGKGFLPGFGQAAIMEDVGHFDITIKEGLRYNILSDAVRRIAFRTKQSDLSHLSSLNDGCHSVQVFLGGILWGVLTLGGKTLVFFVKFMTEVGIVDA